MNPGKLYRTAAWNAYQRGDEIGSLLALDDRWAHRAHHVVVATLLVGVAFVVCVPVKDHVEGRGFVRALGARSVSTAGSGPVDGVFASPGDSVVAGQPIVRLHRVAEDADVARATQELDGLWVRVLRDPLDEEARDALTAGRPALERARAIADERTIRSPISGIVTDVRVREGRHVVAGDTLFVVEPSDAPVEIVAVLPGAMRPQIGERSDARFSIDGADSHASVALVEISSDAVGPAEVKRLLGPAWEDSVEPEGMSFVVTARVDGRDFRADGQSHRFFQGMTGELEVTLDEKPLLFLLVPSLRRWVYR